MKRKLRWAYCILASLGVPCCLSFSFYFLHHTFSTGDTSYLGVGIFQGVLGLVGVYMVPKDIRKLVREGKQNA